MGAGSNAGKREMHSEGRPLVDEEKCIGCGTCARSCAHDGPQRKGNVMQIDWTKCMGCGRCIDACPVDAIYSAYPQSFERLNCKIAEYTKAVLDGRPHFHVTLVRDVSPYCDCYGENDIPIVPDVGMFASFDPVALDLACADAVNAQSVNPGSKLSRANREGLDNLTADFPDTNWRSQITHAKKIGLGEDEYELITI